ncbi:hypothetical protein DL96DRAFT_1619868 [Flagelloscypha sp. PMI_526]|nr:hypothetical protein DL96DRAFT_1619868 [Flagelloscypha sp. PMI_526]
MASTTTHSVQSDILFIDPPEGEERLWININSDATGKRARNWEQATHNVSIEDWRGNKDIALDTTGFQVVSDKPTQFIKNGEVDVDNYYKESIELIKEATGASRVELFDHTIRRRRPNILEDTPDKRQPVYNAHVDQTPFSATQRVHRHLPVADVPSLLSKRFQIINLWRPISNPAWDRPLALCDFRSVNPDRDVVPVQLLYPDREGQTYSVRYNPNQRWGYFRGITPDEFVLIKCFDSKRDVALFTPHTAFIDPSTPKDAPLRESIELRALVFYD